MVVVYGLVAPKLGPVMGASIGFLAACLWWLFLQSYVSEAWQALLPFDLIYVDIRQIRRLPAGLRHRRLVDLDLAALRHPAGPWSPLRYVPGQNPLGRLHRICPRRAVDHHAVHRLLLLQYFLPPQTKFDLILRVVILVTIFSAAYNAEVVRGGLAALPRGQYEAADALGLDYWQAQRLIIMPQALKISIPGIVSTFIGLFKDTTLVSFVGLADPLRGITTIVRADINWKGIYWEPYIFVGAIFFLVCFGMSRYSMYLENKLKTDHR